MLRYSDLTDFAINTGSLYPLHVYLAKNPKVTLDDWFRHARFIVLPLYRKETSEPEEGLSLECLEYVAKDLMDYYAQHIKEL